MSAAHIFESETDAVVAWLEKSLPRIMRRLMDSENLDMPLLQLPLAQMRLAGALYREENEPEATAAGETMGKLSQKLGVRQSALTQAADRLLNHELAERISDPQDRRVVRLRLTEKGREWVSARRARRRAHLHKLWTLLDAEEQEAFLQAVRTLEMVSERLSPKLAETAPCDAAQSPATVEETLSHFTAGAENSSAIRMVKEKGD